MVQHNKGKDFRLPCRWSFGIHPLQAAFFNQLSLHILDRLHQARRVLHGDPGICQVKRLSQRPAFIIRRGPPLADQAHDKLLRHVEGILKVIAPIEVVNQRRIVSSCQRPNLSSWSIRFD